MDIRIKGLDTTDQVVNLNLAHSPDKSEIYLQATDARTGLGGILLSVDVRNGVIKLWHSVPQSLGFPLDGDGRVAYLHSET